MNKKPPQVKCPQCGGVSIFAPSNVYRPFCSERCKQIDFGAWASASFRVAGQPAETEDMLAAIQAQGSQSLH